MMLDFKSLKEDVALAKSEFDLSEQLSRDNTYRNLSFLLLGFLILAAFFISLANNEFDFSKIMSAQFWTDFLITTGGGFLLRWAFGKWGIFAGHQNSEVLKVMKSIESKHKEIQDLGAATYLTEYVEHNNKMRKLNAIRKKVFFKLNKTFAFKTRWQREKDCILIAEKMLKTESMEEFERLNSELSEKNFDLNGYNIRYNKIKETSLKTGTAVSTSTDQKMSYNEMMELFGKKVILTTFTTLMSILFAVSSTTLNDITWTTVYLFVTRITLFVLNSYTGFTTGRSSVETKKLSVLNNIDTFLTRFIESLKKGKEVNYGYDR